MGLRLKTSAVLGSVFNVIKKNYLAWLLILPSVLLFYFMVWRPVGVGFILSFFKLNGYTPVEFAGLDNYVSVISDTLFIKSLVNTCLYVLWSLVIGYLLPVILAIMINEVVHGKSIFKFSAYFPVIVPAVAAMLVWYFLYLPGESGVLNIILRNLGMENFRWLEDSAFTIPLIIVSMTWHTCGAAMLIYLASLQGVNQELYEAATIDGAGVMRRLRTITLPHIYPVMLLMLVRQIIGVFQILMEPLTMTGGGPNNASISLGLQGFYYAFTYFQTENALALGAITFLLMLVLTSFYFKLNDKVVQ